MLPTEVTATFPIKVFGLAQADVESLALSIIEAHYPVAQAVIETRLSKGGKYLAITATLPAASQAQLDAIYRNLSSEKRILMVL